MNRDQLIEIEKHIQNSCAAAEWACYEAQEKMAEAGVGTATGIASFLLSGFNHLEDLPADRQLEMIRLAGRHMALHLEALATAGEDIGEWSGLLHDLKSAASP